MPAIKVHHTDTSDSSWDGPANEARLQNDGTESYYRKAYAWQDPEKDPETKAAYKFINHEVESRLSFGIDRLELKHGSYPQRCGWPRMVRSRDTQQYSMSGARTSAGSGRKSVPVLSLKP